MNNIEKLKSEIKQREEELAALKEKLAVDEANMKVGENGDDWKWPLPQEEYTRYSRQMIVPSFGLQGQQRIRKAKVLLVGAGGLGCPAAAYLAGAGVGTLGLADADEVEVSNLHRQVAHSTSRVGMKKVDSAIAYLKEFNPTITYQSHPAHLTPQNAQSIVSQYDLILDCTDHPTSRYLISDICVLLSKPLVSASAFQSSGQLLVLNNPPGQGPCYRCVFPKPPPPESVVGCGEGGIIGPVVGVMGVLQALEAIKLIIRGGLETTDQPAKQMTMLIFSAMADTPFRTVRMRGRREDCFACSGKLTLDELKHSLDYVQFCGVVQPVKLLGPEERVTVAEYQAAAAKEHLLIDTREKEHFSLNGIPNAINIPISRFMSYREDTQRPEGWIPEDLPREAPIYVVCRVGNDSQVATKKLKEMGFGEGRFVGDIEGGLRAWRDGVDGSMPFI